MPASSIPFPADRPGLWLAPMQDVTTRPFWEVLQRRGGPDIYVTEYFRVHHGSHLRPHILDSIVRKPSGSMVMAQLIGNHVSDMVRIARALQQYDILGIDLNLGCPAPVVCGKQCGGALLKHPELVRELVLRLRDEIDGALTIKTRVGFESEHEFPELLALFASLPIQALSIHGRTVHERYRSPVHTREIADAVRAAPFPVLANGSMVCLDSSLAMLKQTGAAGLMIGRGAIRNPWIFEQIRQHFAGVPLFRPRCHDMLHYIEDLSDRIRSAGRSDDEVRHINYMKKFMNYVCVDLFDGAFWTLLRRCNTEAAFRDICHEFLDSPRILDFGTSPDSKVFCGVHELIAEA